MLITSLNGHSPNSGDIGKKREIPIKNTLEPNPSTPIRWPNIFHPKIRLDAICLQCKIISI